VNYKDDLQEGEYKELYPSGKPKLIGKYKAGKKEGVWTEYNAEGKLTKTTYKNDQPVDK